MKQKMREIVKDLRLMLSIVLPIVEMVYMLKEICNK